jgi:hypothetical protein
VIWAKRPTKEAPKENKEVWYLTQLRRLVGGIINLWLLFLIYDNEVEFNKITESK